MIFLMEYDRRKSRIVSLRRYNDSERRKAEVCRLETELQLHRSGIAREIVLLEAASERALRRTHRRYFQDAREIVESTDKEVK